MKRLLLIFVGLLMAGVSFSQTSSKYKISGEVRDSLSGAPLGYATVTVRDSAKVITAAYTDDKGLYSLMIPRGEYNIKYSLIGYTTYECPLSVTKSAVLEPALLKEGVEIAAAVVTAQLVTSDIDKTTYNTAADPETPSLTVLEMMKKVPMLTVDGEDNIKLKGQSNFKILVNGKSSSLMSNNYKDVLKSMPANSIKNIEVITNPPAKYDAEGIGGIINIITNRKVPDGFNGSVWASGDLFGGWNAGTYIAGTVGKFNISGTLYGGRYRNPESSVFADRENFNSDIFHTQKYTSATSNFGDYEGLNLEASYEFDSLNLLTLTFNGNLGNSYQNSNAMAEMFDINNMPTSSYTNYSKTAGAFGGIGASLDYQRTFKKPDQTFTASYKFDYSPNNSSFDSRLDAISGIATSYHNRSDNNAWGAEHAIQLDYFDPINKHHQVEAGLKYTLRPNMSNSTNETLVGDQWINNPSLRNDLDYIQHVAAAYAAYQFKTGNFSVKGGLRAEFTVNDGQFKMAETQPLFNRYFNIVPHLTFGYKISDQQNLRLGYTQRLSRPGIWLLNPYVNTQEPMNITTGNPNLESELTHSFDFTYGLYTAKFNLNTSLSAMITNNSIEQVSTLLEDGGAMITRPENIGRRNNYSFNVSSGLRLWENKLNLNLNGSISYVTVDANNGSGDKNQGWQGSVFMFGNVQTWKNGQVSIYGGTFINEIGLQSREKFFYYYGIGVSQTFLDKKLRLNLSAQNPFTKYSFFAMSSGDNNYYQHLTMQNRSQTIRLGISYRFGKATGGVKKASRTIDNSDLKGGGQKATEQQAQ